MKQKNNNNKATTTKGTLAFIGQHVVGNQTTKCTIELQSVDINKTLTKYLTIEFERQQLNDRQRAALKHFTQYLQERQYTLFKMKFTD